MPVTFMEMMEILVQESCQTLYYASGLIIYWCVYHALESVLAQIMQYKFSGD